MQSLVALMAFLPLAVLASVQVPSGNDDAQASGSTSSTGLMHPSPYTLSMVGQPTTFVTLTILDTTSDTDSMTLPFTSPGSDSMTLPFTTPGAVRDDAPVKTITESGQSDLFTSVPAQTLSTSSAEVSSTTDVNIPSLMTSTAPGVFPQAYSLQCSKSICFQYCHCSTDGIVSCPTPPSQDEQCEVGCQCVQISTSTSTPADEAEPHAAVVWSTSTTSCNTNFQVCMAKRTTSVTDSMTLPFTTSGSDSMTLPFTPPVLIEDTGSMMLPFTTLSTSTTSDTVTLPFTTPKGSAMPTMLLAVSSTTRNLPWESTIPQSPPGTA
ncbi:hypothetical protein E8E14_007021 [Neopestalotiopsis sp. 37M]|nr:hypothetical protein E8E14_007021 [Neopestalotiopsis sp. 37M]